MYKYTVIIDGMKCSMCESHINNIIRINYDVKRVKSSHKKNMTTFISKELINNEQLKKDIENTGYRVLDIKYE